jgi:hypothetical protein
MMSINWSRKPGDRRRGFDRRAAQRRDKSDRRQRSERRDLELSFPRRRWTDMVRLPEESELI